MTPSLPWAAHYEREEALTGSIRDALTYPLIMLGMLSCGPPLC